MARSLIPNSTQIPDVILDHWMAELSGTEFKVLLYVARRTFGFGKEADAISLNQISRGLTRRDGTVLDRGTGVSRSSVAAALKSLEEKGLILRTTNRSDTGREYEENTYRINLDWVAPNQNGTPGGEMSEGSPPEEGGGGVVQKLDHLVQKSDYPVQKLDGGWSKNWTTVVQKLDPQETDLQETDQETAAAPTANAPPSPTATGAAAEPLVKELLSHGVGRAVALELAREKPEQCLRYLEYLPFAEVKTTKGAWLTSAIRKEFGPPAAYLKAQKAKRSLAVSTADAGNASQSQEVARQELIRGQLRETYRQLEKSQPEAIVAFQEYLAAERMRTEDFSARLSLRRRQELLAELKTEEYRLEHFGRWVRDWKTRPSYSAEATLPQMASAVSLEELSLGG